jgi:hypothetical protein
MAVAINAIVSPSVLTMVWGNPKPLSLPYIAVAPGTHVLVIPAVPTSVVAHVILPESVLVTQKTSRQVAVAPVMAIRHVACVTKVDGVLVILAVVGVVTHWLPPRSDCSASSDGALGVVIAVVAGVPHLLEIVNACRHPVLSKKLHVAPCAVVH